MATFLPNFKFSLAFLCVAHVKVSWDGDGSMIKANDERITHHIMDRPSQNHRYFTCEYVQPQWVFDSVNNRTLLPVSR